MTDLVSKAEVLALVQRWAEATWEEGSSKCGEGDPVMGAAMNSCADVLEQIIADIAALPAADPRSDLEALRDEFSTPAALNREGDSEG